MIRSETYPFRLDDVLGLCDNVPADGSLVQNLKRHGSSLEFDHRHGDRFTRSTIKGHLELHRVWEINRIMHRQQKLNNYTVLQNPTRHKYTLSDKIRNIHHP